MPSTQAQHPKLLIADDEEMNLTVLTRALQRRGYETALAIDGLDAVNKVRELKQNPNDAPSVVLMDINMPNMNGIEATRILKDEFKDLPIIAVTAFAMDDDFDFHSYGFDELCRKPVNFSELLHKIEECQLPH